MYPTAKMGEKVSPWLTVLYHKYTLCSNNTYSLPLIYLSFSGIRGPVSIGLNGMGFAFYAGGVFNNTKCVNDINHGMIAVGYGIKGNQKYWILKNSWGKTWGDKGYIYLGRNENLCGIGQMNVIPVIA